MRVILLDPAAFTTPYDHHLAAALAERGLDVDLVTSSFRFGEGYEPTGYTRSELFYPLSNRLFRRSRLRLPLKALEHADGLRRVRGMDADVLHAQWAPLPKVDLRLLPSSVPTVMTAHDILPRRWGDQPDLWRRLYARFDRVVVHSSNGRERLVTELSVPADAVRVIPHPVFPGPVRDEDDGRTVLFLGVIRPYKQIDHAIDAARAVAARLLVVGDPTFDLGERTELPDVEWRLGYLPHEEIDQALAETTVAVFTYRDELDQSGALLRALGAGVPAVAYDVGGVAEPVRDYGAGAVVKPDDQAGLAAAISTLLEDPDALAAARAGARRAREALSWSVAAQAHEELYLDLVASTHGPA